MNTPNMDSIKGSRLFTRGFCKIWILWLLLGSLATQVMGQVSPVGTWHFDLNGRTRGVAVLTFEEDGSLFGTVVLVPFVVPEVEFTDQVFGSGEVEGSWVQNGRGVTAANFEIFEAEEAENFFASFTGQVRPGVFNASASGTNGRFKMLGRRQAFVVRDASGIYSLVGQRHRADLEEGESGGFFVETLTVTPTGSPAIFDVVGRGPNYDVSGIMIIGRSGRVALSVSVRETLPPEEPEEPGDGEEPGEGEEPIDTRPRLIRSLSGQLNRSGFSATLRGVEEDDTGVDRLRVQLRRTSRLP